MKRFALLSLAVALLYAGPGFLPGRTLVPVDLLSDFGAWKEDPTVRLRVSNSLLSDVVIQFVAWDDEVRRLLAAGELPWVNRWAGDGGPLFANPQTALLSPFTAPRLLLGIDGWAITALLKLLAAAMCAYWFARELGVEQKQAVVSSLIFATAGFMTVWLLWPHTNVFALLPGLGAASLRLMKQPGRRAAAAVILFAALCTAGGHPETLFIGVNGLMIFLLWEADRRPDLGLKAAVPVLVGSALGFALLALQLVPFFSILAHSHAAASRPALDHPFRIWGALSQLLPGVLGSPLRGELDLTAVVRAESFHFRAAGFIGAIALLALLFAWRELTPTLRRGLIVGSAALLLSWYPPGLRAIVRHAPVLRVAALEYGVTLFVLFGSMAAGPALASLAAQGRRKLGLLLLAAGAAAAVAGTLPAVPAARPALTSAARSGIESLRTRGHLLQPAAVYEQRLAYYLDAASSTTVRRVALPGLLWLLAGLTLAFPVLRRAALLSTLAVGELLLFGAGFNPAVDRARAAPEPAAIAAIRQLDPAQNFLLAAHFEIFPANAGTIYQVRDAVSYDVLNSRARVANLHAGGYDAMAHSFNPILRPEEVRRLGALGVRWVLSRGDVAGAQRLPGPPAPAVGVYEIATAIPQSLPANEPPSGLLVGGVITLIAAAAGYIWLQLFTTDSAGS